MEALKKTITILGVVALVLLVTLVVVALWAINKKESNYMKVAAATANRWPKKDSAQDVTQSNGKEQTENTNGSPQMAAAPGADLSNSGNGYPSL